jgi:hypothetical protein
MPTFSFWSCVCRDDNMRAKHVLYITAFSCLIIAANCQNRKMSSQQRGNSMITKIEFTSLTRGYQKHIFIAPDSLKETVEGRQENNKVVKRKLPAGDWDALTKSISNLTLSGIPELPSPTSRRAFDGALHSTITISTKDGKTYSHTFDDENPHEKLQPLMKAIKKVGEEGEK